MQSGADARRAAGRSPTASTRRRSPDLVGRAGRRGRGRREPRRRTRSASIRVHGQGPLSDLLSSALRCSGARISHSSQPHAVVRADNTDLVVLSDSSGRRSAAGARSARRPGTAPAGPGARRRRPGRPAGDSRGDELPAMRGPAPQRPRRGLAGGGRPAARHRRQRGPGHRAGHRGPGTEPGRPRHQGGARQRRPRARRRTRRRPCTPRWSSTSRPARSWPDAGHGIPGARADTRLLTTSAASWMMDVVADIKRGGAARNAKLASLPVGMAGRAALGFGKRLTGTSKDEVNAELMEKAAHQLFTVLGELKGGAMKVGQALSVMEAAIPEQFGEPYREALTKLQKDAPPLPAAKVHRVLDATAGHQVARAVHVVRRHAGGLGQHRPGAQGGVVRRSRGRRQDPVPRRRRGAARRPEDHEADGQGVQAALPRRRCAGRRRRADRAHRDGARLPARGRQPARLRQGLRGTPAFRGPAHRGQRAQGRDRRMDRGHPDVADHPRAAHRSSAT